MAKQRHHLIAMQLAIAVVILTTTAAEARGRVHFRSTYTNLERDCRAIPGPDIEAQDAPQVCPGPGSYKLRITYSALSTQVNVISHGSTFSRILNSDSTCDATFDPQIEWRLMQKLPFAVIARIHCQKRSFVLVRGLKGYERIERILLDNGRGTIIQARHFVDAMYKQVSLRSR